MTCNNTNPGLYIHVPFCRGKCPYCDFYSVVPTEELKSRYTSALTERLKKYANMRFGTVYFGGGTPSLLGAESIARILSKVNFAENAEITVECNPSDSGTADGFDFSAAAKAGVNRISLGLQSADDNERKLLGRRAGADMAKAAMQRAFAAGITNISLDLMLGVSGQTPESLHRSVEFCLDSGAKHISAYMLKIEPGTFFHKKRDSLLLPSEDETCDLYLQCCEELKAGGMNHYEISNFSFPGFESRHNLKYWRCEEYLGLGPAAHSFLNGRRIYYERDVEAFINGAEPADDGTGGDFNEYLMLALRLSEGVIFKKTEERFGFPFPEKIKKKARFLSSHSLTEINDERIRLTEKGFLLSNSIISELLDYN